MFRNNVKIALRNLARHRLYSFINVAGLSIGIACGTLILLFVRHEFTADRFHEHLADLYRVYRVEHRVNGDTKISAGVSTPVGPALLRDLPNVEDAVRMRGGSVQVEVANRVYTQPVLFADAAFFSAFTFPFEGPTVGEPLTDRHSIVLGEEAARRYFGSENPVGKALSVYLGEEPEEFVVGGVAAPFPNNSSITFEMLLPLENWPGYVQQADNWGAFNVAVYVRLAHEADVASVGAGLDRLVRPWYGEMIDRNQASGWWVQGDDAFDLELQPLGDVHFADGFTNMVAVTADPNGLYVLMGIGLLVLLLACFNFMVLSAGRAAVRAREVGVRKSLGAFRWQLAMQFWGEAVLTSLLSLLVGLTIASAALPLFNTLASTDLGMQNVDLPLALQLVSLALLTGLVAGCYPALILSGFRPARVLKGDRSTVKGLSFSRVMVVMQFAISIGMITSTLILFDQLEYLKSKDLGFSDEEVVTVDLQAPQTDEDRLFERFKHELVGRSEVVSVSSTSYALADGWSRISLRQGEKQTIVYLSRVDSDYFTTMGLRIVAGRGFRDDREGDRRDVVINEALAAELDFDNPVGELLPGYEAEGVRILGVVGDFNYQSLRGRIEPLILHMSPSLTAINYALVRIRTGQVARALEEVGEAWQAVAPEQPYEVEFLDRRLDALYSAEERWSHIVRAAAFLAIAIACLGLFGLATLTAGRRTKEIGIRKVLGASVQGVVGLLSRDFAVLLALGFVAAAPVSWIVMQRWLAGFAYHIRPGPGVFLLSGALVAAVAAATVGWHTIRAASADPVKSLRYE